MNETLWNENTPSQNDDVIIPNIYGSFEINSEMTNLNPDINFEPAVFRQSSFSFPLFKVSID